MTIYILMWYFPSSVRGKVKSFECIHMHLVVTILLLFGFLQAWMAIIVNSHAKSATCSCLNGLPGSSLPLPGTKVDQFPIQITWSHLS